MKKTNFAIIKELFDNFSAKNNRILEVDEIYKIAEIAELDGKTKLELQNLRDFLVYFFSDKKNEVRDQINKVVISADGSGKATVGALSERFDEISKNLSAITMMIDNMIIMASSIKH